MRNVRANRSAQAELSGVCPRVSVCGSEAGIWKSPEEGVMWQALSCSSSCGVRGREHVYRGTEVIISRRWLSNITLITLSVDGGKDRRMGIPFGAFDALFIGRSKKVIVCS